MDNSSQYVSKISGIKCCVPNCSKSRRNGKRLFEFNERRFKLNTWLEFCNMTIKDLNKKKYFICEDHFDQQFLSNKKLAVNAFPTKKTNVSIAQPIVTNTQNCIIMNSDTISLIPIESHASDNELVSPIFSSINLNDVNKLSEQLHHRNQTATYENCRSESLNMPIESIANENLLPINETNVNTAKKIKSAYDLSSSNHVTIDESICFVQTPYASLTEPTKYTQVKPSYTQAFQNDFISNQNQEDQSFSLQ